MSTRSLLTVIGGVIGAAYGYPQLGFALGALVGSAVDPQIIQGPKIGEVQAQTSAEGAPRTIIHGTAPCIGNVIQTGPLVKVTVSEEQGKGGPEVQTEKGYRTYAIRVCEGPISGYLRIWEDNKLVYDVRQGSQMLDESAKWAQGVVFYYGDESQLPDPNLVALNADAPAHRGSAYVVVSKDVTSRAGSIPQYRFEVAKEITAPAIGGLTNSITAPGIIWLNWIYRDADGGLSLCYQTGTTTVPGGQFFQRKYANDLSTVSTTPVTMVDMTGEVTPAPTTYRPCGPSSGAVFGYGTTGGDPAVVTIGGEFKANLRPTGLPINWFDTSVAGNHQSDGRRVWATEDCIYVGVTTRAGNTVNSLFMWPSGVTGNDVAQMGTVAGVCVTPGNEFFVSLDRDETVYILNDVGQFSRYTKTLSSQISTDMLPFSLSGFHGFGADAAGGIAVFAYNSPSNRLEVRKMSDWSLVKTITDSAFGNATATRVIFTDDSCYVQCADVTLGTTVVRIEYQASMGGVPTTLAAIIADCHDRVGFPASKRDVSELEGIEVEGAAFAGDYTAADCINTLRPGYFFYKSQYDGQLHYPLLGGEVIETITIDDLVEMPDTTRREQALEVPKKLHLYYAHAVSGYARVKATAPRTNTPDLLTSGEASIELPAVINEDEAAQIVDKMYKVTRTEVNGQSKLVVPMRKIKYVPGRCIGVSLRGQVRRQRIEQMDINDGQIELTLKDDRQSAYTSALTGVPIPPPTLPPSTIVGDTVQVILDMASRVDSEDDLNYLVAVSGARPAWYGARYQRSFDGGANYSTVDDISTASIIGTLLEDVAEASPYFTDGTNQVKVMLYRASQTLESINDTQFLSEGNPFALVRPDGSVEVMQFRDAVEEVDGSFTLSTLHRGLLNSGGTAHTAGALFVMLQRPTHIPAQAGWIGQAITHRSISFGESAETTTNDQTLTFVGRSQIEWPIAYLSLARDGSDVITGTWTPRHRFGSPNYPVASINFQGYRVTVDDGTTSVTFDRATPDFSYDASAMSAPVTVSVSALNRITGPGPSTSDTV